jgi:large subunit ribosomal protein L9
MKVILQKDIEKLGVIGDIVNVKDGYARNYLIPKGFALKAFENNLKQFEHQKKSLVAKINKQKKDAMSLAEKIEAHSCTIAKKVGENEKLFGSVTNIDIEEALKKDNFDISRKNIIIKEPIKSLGVYTVLVKVAKDMDANLKVWVVAE